MISIVIPVYNAARYITQTLACVFDQTHSDWELILVDDCSTDDSVNVIKAFIDERNGNDRTRLIVLDEETGGTAAKARNAGIAAAKGRYIAFLDADDLWDKDKLHLQRTFMEMKQAAFTFTSYEFGDEQAAGTGKIVRAPKELTYDKALSRTVIFTSTVMLDKEMIPAQLLTMPDIESEDTAMWWQLLRNGIHAYGLDRVLTVYRRPAKSLSSNKWTAVKRIWGLYRHEGLSFPKAVCSFFGWAVRATLRRI